MGSAPAGRPFRVCCARIVAICRQEDRACCIPANRARVYVPLFLAKHIATNDEITFPIPVEEITDAEMYIEKAPPSRAKACLYLTAIRQVTQPKLDKRDQSFVSAKVRDGNLGISSVFLHCGIIRDYFYRTQAVEDGSERTNLYQTLRIAPSASPAEIRVAFKLRALELEMTGAARAEQAKLERAFNILGHPELRAHYDSLLANWELPAVLPYGGVGSLLVAGDRSPLAVRRSLRGAFWPSCRIRCTDDFTYDCAIVSFTRTRLCSMTRAGSFNSGLILPFCGARRSASWETGLPSRLSVKIPPNLEQDVQRARSMYSRFGQ